MSQRKREPSSVTARRYRGVLFEAHQFAAGTEEAFPRHSHEEYQFYVSLNTPSSYRYRGERHVVSPGSLFILRGGELHEPRSVGMREAPQYFQMWYVAPETLRDLSAAPAGRKQADPFFTAAPITDTDSVRLASSLMGRLRASATELEAEETLLSTFQHLIVRFSDLRPRRSSFSIALAHRVRDYLHAHWNHNLSLSDLAREFGVSPSYLSRTFRRAFRVPPYAYHTQIRIDRAKELLISGRLPGDVAVATGFYDQSHFTTRFRRLVGVTPARYRSHR